MGVKGIYGLSGSGIDVESLVKVGMMTKQSEYDKMYKKEIQETWQKEAYASIYTDLATFKTTVSTYNKESTMNAMTTSSSNTSSVTATANGAAAAMSHSVKVSSLTSNAYLLSKNAITRNSMSSSSTSSIYLRDVVFGSLTQNTDGTYSVQKELGTYYNTGGSTTNIVKVVDPTNSSNTYNLSDLSTTDGTTYTLGGQSYSLSDLSFKVSSDGGSNYTTVAGSSMRINTTSTTSGGTTAYTIDSATAYTSATVNGTDTALSYTLSDGSSTATISYTYADLYGGKTLNDLAADINDQNLNITANYDSTNDAFSLYNNTGGTSNTIGITTLTDTTSALFNNLQLASTDGTTMEDSARTFTTNTENTVAGVSGSVTIDGKTYSNLTSNKLTVAGVSYTFLQPTDSNASVTVTQDTDTVISTVKQFITDYNKMLDELNDKYYEDQYSDYEPLTSSQQSSMTATQISEWNEKAKSGMLYHSSILRSTINNMREAIYTPVDSVDSNYNSASAIGISSSTNKGHLTLDEDTLKEALAADPDCVYQIFGSMQDSDSSEASIKSSDYSNTGIANRLYFDVTTNSLSELSDYAGTSDETDDSSYLGTLITNLQTKMSNFKVQMDAYEDLLYSKYDAMETAIATLSSQLSSITGSTSSS